MRLETSGGNNRSALHLPLAGRAIAYGVFICMTYQRVVPANAGTHTPRTLVLALERRPFFTFEARGDGSLRSQGRLVERRALATSGVAGIGFSALPPNPGLMLWSTLASPTTAAA